MFEWFTNLFLIREIRSKTGALHFRRWSLLNTRWGSLYIHQIARSDEDLHMHDHPWDFWSLILRGGYTEQAMPEGKDFLILTNCVPGTLVMRKAKDFHRIKLLNPLDSTWSLVWTGSRIHEPWGYHTFDGWVSNQEYRRMKREGYWDGSRTRS
jgi:hypothetical protein